MAWTTTERGAPSKQPYVHQAYPKMVYHADGRYQVVADEVAWAALGAEWGYFQPASDGAEKPTRTIDQIAAPYEAVTASLKRGRKAKA
jgi:hypothetical protein